MANRLDKIAFTDGFDGFGYQELDGDGNLIAIYDLDGDQLGSTSESFPVCEWKFIEIVGTYDEDDTDAFWALVQEHDDRYSVTWVGDVEIVFPPRVSLAEVLEICQAHGVKAELFDDAGSRKGWVHADGTYRLVLLFTRTCVRLTFAPRLRCGCRVPGPVGRLVAA